MGKKGKRLAAALLAAGLALSASGCDWTQVRDQRSWADGEPLAVGEPVAVLDGYGVNAAVLYEGGDGSEGGEIWADTYGYLTQSTLVGLEADALDVRYDLDLEQYHILYVDGSVAAAKDLSRVTDAVVSFADAGGCVVLENSLYPVFDRDFIGASDYRKVTGCPVDLDFPHLGEDIGELQEILSDFASLYTSYEDFEKLSERDYGYAVVCDTAETIAGWEEAGLYTVNRYGKGYVFFTNPLLPNFFSISGFDMLQKDADQLTFSNSTAGCNQLLVNAYAGFASKRRYGYYIGRVFGSFGSPDMAWELHYEEITGIANNSMKTFSELSKEYLQVPSFTLIRNSYTWFLRTETVTYYLGELTDGADNSSNRSGNRGGDNRSGSRYSLDLYENAYSSGTHIAAGREWLSLGRIENGGSYFLDYPEYDYRAYPALCDYNGDGVVDLFCGSYDGKLYYYEGKSFADRLCVAEAQVLRDGAGNPLAVGSYSAPQLADIDGDGYLDILCGSGDGNLYWFSGDGSLTFEPRGILLKTEIQGQCLPSVGDLNGDGVIDIAVGSNEGILLVFYGAEQEDGSVSFSHETMEGLSARCVNAGLGVWLAPEITVAGDAGRLAVGTYGGYVALFDPDRSGRLAFTGYLEAEEMNYRGNRRIKTGNNCVPVFYDINGDGALDLICGSLEYGLAYPIDSKYFPYAETLKKQVQYAVENDFYLGTHFYTHAYSSAAREAQELDFHVEAMKEYGVDASGRGTNQHTWKMNADNQTQSLLSAWEAGLLWNSGFSSAGAVNEPHKAAENVIAAPFFLTSDGEPTILVQNCSVLPYRTAAWTDITGKYGVPVCIYYHCDFVYESDQEARSYLEQASDFWWKHGYNFVGEDQLMTATAAAYNLTVQVEGGLADGVGGIALTPGAADTDFPLYCDDYQNSSGAKIVFAQWVDTESLSVDADVWRLSGSELYLGLNRTVSVSCGGQIKDERQAADNGQAADSGGNGTNGQEAGDSHILRVNVAAEIASSARGAEIAFLDGGMMQVVVCGEAVTLSKGWIVTARDDCTIFTKYGSADELKISYE